MTDLITTALRELESDAPDPEATRDAVYQGIHTRARHRRMATVGAAAVGVVTLAAGAIFVTGGLPQGDHVPAGPGGSHLVQFTIPDAEFPVVVPDDLAKGSSQQVRVSGSASEINFHWADGPPRFTLAASSSEPPREFAGKTPLLEEDTAVNGQPATLRVYRTGVDISHGYRLVWKTPSGEWITVSAASEQRSKTVAKALEYPGGANARKTLHPPLNVKYAPEGFPFYQEGWRDPAHPAVSRSALNLCPTENFHDANCYSIEVYVKEFAQPIKDGPEPTDRCRANVERSLVFGRPRAVDGSTVRLSSDGCDALKLRDGADPIIVHGPEAIDSPLMPDELAKFAASIEVRP